MRKQQAGFTLIELVMVIVILGILAATAAPKFLNLQRDARVAALDGMAGSLKSAASIVHTACLLDRTAIPCSVSAAASSVTIEGTAIATAYGWPDATAIQTAADVTLGNFAASLNAGNNIYTLQLNGSATCQTTYTEPAAVNTTPVVAVSNAGC